jgi:hypothetical protein
MRQRAGCYRGNTGGQDGSATSSSLQSGIKSLGSLINDAFVEYYATDHATVRAGQFIVPFGFDMQQSSQLWS